MADIATQDEARRLLGEGARLLYTVAAGQYFELGDINAWFEQYNQLVEPLDLESLDLGHQYGAIAARTGETDPLIEKAQAAFADLVVRATQARDDFGNAVVAARQSGGGQ